MEATSSMQAIQQCMAGWLTLMAQCDYSGIKQLLAKSGLLPRAHM